MRLHSLAWFPSKLSHLLFISFLALQKRLKLPPLKEILKISGNADGIRALLLDRNKEVVAKVKDLKERKKREEI